MPADFKRRDASDAITDDGSGLVFCSSGNALSVDREQFAKLITEKSGKTPIFSFIQRMSKDFGRATVLATGPLTSDELVDDISNIIGVKALFYDANAPIISKDSINLNIAYYKSRYEQGDDSYINCPFSRMNIIILSMNCKSRDRQAARFSESQYFEGCLPIEVLAKRGVDTSLWAAKPKGLALDRSCPPYAVVQLRQDNLIATLYNIVGSSRTNLTYREQERVFALFPA